jgi:hypothetical protein
MILVSFLLFPKNKIKHHDYRNGDHCDDRGQARISIPRENFEDLRAVVRGKKCEDRVARCAA